MNQPFYPWVQAQGEKICEYVHQKTCSRMSMTALPIITKNSESPKCSSMWEWIHELWYIHTMEYDSAEHGLLMYLTTWMNLTYITLGKKISLDTVHTLCVHLNEIQNHTKLTNIYKSQNSGLLLGSCWLGRGMRELSRVEFCILICMVITGCIHM